MTTPLLPVITEAGLAAVFRKTADGLSAEISHIAVGDSGYTPAQNQTTLRHEVARFPVADGVMVAPNQAHMTALDDTQREYWVREVGFYLGDGTLFAVYSNPTNPLAYKTAGNDFLHAYDLLLTAVPAGSVIVNSTGARLSLYFAEEFTKIATELVRGMRNEWEQGQQIDALTQRCTNTDKTLSMMDTRLVASEGINRSLMESVGEQRNLLMNLATFVVRNERLHAQAVLS